MSKAINSSVNNNVQKNVKDKNSYLYSFKTQYDLYLMILPVIILFFIFKYIPIYGATIAFKDYDLTKGVAGGEWVGLKYFKQFFNDPYCFRLIKNTFLLSFYELLWGFPAPIILALLFNEVKNKSFKKVTQSISYLPHFISTVIMVSILMKLFSNNGIVNTFIQQLGFPKQLFFADPKWFRTMYVGSSVWKKTGWNSIIYLAALSGISPELYEAAIMDGANRFKQIRHITIPGIMPIINILLILATANIMDVGFEKVYLMYNPLVYSTADVISTYVYRRGIESFDFSYATAVGLFNSAISLILLVTANYISGKVSENSLY